MEKLNLPDDNSLASSEKAPLVLGYNTESVRRLVTTEGKQKFLSEADEDTKNWNDRYNELLLRDELALETTKNLVETSTNADVTDRAHLFVSLDYLDNFSRKADQEGKTIRLELPRKEVVSIPLGMFISAESFEDWRGREKGFLKDGRESSEVIQEYANMDSSPPPVDDIRGFLLPDGRLYFKSNNAHRVAAAIQRGDQHINFSGTLDLSILDEIPEKL